jgi:hypothetical protein
VPCPQAIRVFDEATELVDRRRCRSDVAGAEQRFAPIQRELCALRVFGIESLERATQQARGERHVVARERTPARGREAARRALAERTALRIQRAELAQVLMRLLEMPSDRLVVLDGIACACLDPVGQARVQIGAGVLQQAPVSRVADQHVVEAQRGLAEKPAGVRLDQLTLS